MKVAIVHDWLVGGGAENVVLELHNLFPDAPIYTSYATIEWQEKLDGKVVTGFLQKWPFSKLRKFLPLLRIWWFGHLDFSNYDLVISSSGNGEAKGIKTPVSTKHVCYCHTPTHFYWRHYDQYIKEPGFGFFNPLARLGLKVLAGPLRNWDYKAAQRPDYFIANSSHIQSDIKKYYGRDSTVIHPPVYIERFEKAEAGMRQGFVTMGRLVPYKRVDIIIKACNEMGLPLKVIGRGPELANLQKLAGPNIKFLQNVSNDEMPEQLASSSAFIFAAFEDFGIAPVEALAAGTPVIAYKNGGALDYVKPGENGLFFGDQAAGSLAECLQSFEPSAFVQNKIKISAQGFSPENFRNKILQLLSK